MNTYEYININNIYLNIKINKQVNCFFLFQLKVQPQTTVITTSKCYK